MAMADRVLDYSARTGVISIRPIWLDQAFVGLYFRTVVLASTLTLDLLTGEEFAALVAHEIGHDCRWNDYWAALNARDSARMRELELWADAIAVLTLERIGIDPERLVSAVTKQTEHNRLQRAVADPDAVSQTSVDRYVPLDQRVAFIRAIAGIRWAAPPSTMTSR
jgi:Zn-dependent protease with chaperone function